MVPPVHPILLVEDNPADYVVVIRTLRQEGVQNPIVHFPSSASALRFLGRRQAYRVSTHPPCPGVLLFDLHHTGTERRKTLAVLKQQPVLQEIPIIVLTAPSEAQDLDAWYAAGANSHIIKPLNFTGFLAALQHLKSCQFEIVFDAQSSTIP